MRHKRLIIFFIGIGLTFILAGILPFAAAQETTPEGTPEATSAAAPVAEATEQFYDLENVPVVEPTGDNSYCVLCHNQPLQTVRLRDGNILNLYVSPEVIANSVHGTSNEIGALGCVDCHGAESFPHDGQTPADQRAYTIRSVGFCINCHADQVDALQSGLHEQAILAGNTAAAVCTDCHGAHDIQPVARFPELVAGVCGDCHTTTLAEWQISAHVDIGPLDCATCHSPHTQAIRGGLNSDELCLNCHKDTTDVFVHTQHVNDVYEVTCTDCHMFMPPHGDTISTVPAINSNLATGHTMIVDTVACNTCHQELVSSGEWTAISADIDSVRAERDALQQRVSELESTESNATNDQASLIQLLQGLILGIGFGITGAAVFITRGNRQIEIQTEDVVEGETHE